MLSERFMKWNKIIKVLFLFPFTIIAAPFFVLFYFLFELGRQALILSGEVIQALRRYPEHCIDFVRYQSMKEYYIAKRKEDFDKIMSNVTQDNIKEDL